MTRAVTSWASKIASRKCSPKVNTNDRIKYLNKINATTQDGLKFYDWLDKYLAKKNPYLAKDTHFTSISDKCGINTTRFIKLETLEEHTFDDYIRNLGGTVKPIEKKHSSNFTVDSSNNFREINSNINSMRVYADALKIIYKVYADDFETYDYVKNVKEDMKYLQENIKEECLI